MLCVSHIPKVEAMNTFIRVGLTLCVAACGTVAHAGKATTDLSGLDEDTRALVAKERARQMMFKSDGEKKQAESDRAISGDSSYVGSKRLDDKQAIVKKGGVTGGCNMDIGNSDGGRSGFGVSKPKPVIITGPVVQLCK